MKIRKLCSAVVPFTLVGLLSLSLSAGQTPTPSSDPAVSAAHNWTTDQIITATVHQAWVLSGRDEATFFEIVKELAEISANNRHLTLPDSPAVGKRTGAYIRAQAQADHDQLLYAIVDKAVRMSGTKAPAPAK